MPLSPLPTGIFKRLNLYLRYSRCNFRPVQFKKDLQEVGGGCGDWMELAQDRDRWRALVITVMNVRVPKCGEFLD
jgi:hypothetical protein